LPINFLITVNFHGFKEVVDKLGGVWMDVDRRYYNRNTGAAYDDYANIDLQPGYQKLDGEQALDFVRFRHTDDDYHRVARQQEFVRAVKDQVAQSFDPFRLPALVNAMVSNIEVAEGGHKLSGGEVLSYALFAEGLPGGHILQPRIEGITGASITTAPPGAVAAAVSQFTHPDVESSKEANAAALGRRPRQTAPPPSKVSLLVLNGNGVPGGAANTSYLLAERGYQTLLPANSAEANAAREVSRTRIYFDPAQPRARAAATALRQLISPALIEQLPRGGRLRALDPGATLVVVLGRTFGGTVAPVPTAAVPAHQAPYVRVDPSQATPLLLPLARKARFPLMVPTVLERGSYPDTLATDTPVRYYTIEGAHKAVRLVFHTGAGEFWGVEETDWQNAPILADRSFRHDLGGREFELYYAGSHLHMVVLNTPRASYWIVNTLLDSLSNETMLAIAEGLKPLASQR
jgi:LytR_cpsA_psr family/LytR cell envelope-related transcriptional attenuator